LIVPVAKIAAMARKKGIDTITDSAHALGQVKFSLPELGSDFVGLNLHKWMGNPVGGGVLYIKKARIKEMVPYLEMLMLQKIVLQSWRISEPRLLLLS
ncbi:MAG TPA: aminotransferase class V-fold PLP-dependent enzyme, partial [Ferruginibacter sp.]|nr:aminotransferase class V-fold PLP-dependent enzyme [Ferruginibacter sp.]